MDYHHYLSYAERMALFFCSYTCFVQRLKSISCVRLGKDFKMKKIYYVKKDVVLPAEDGNWIIMTEKQYCRFVETEDGKKRKPYFAEVLPALKNDPIYVFECDSLEKAKAIKAENDRRRYCYKTMSDAGFSVVSFNSLDIDETNGEDCIPDPDQDVETSVVTEIRDAILMEVVMELPCEKRELIENLYLGEEQLSDAEYAKRAGCSRQNVNRKKVKILEEIKNELIRKKFENPCC